MDQQRLRRDSNPRFPVRQTGGHSSWPAEPYLGTTGRTRTLAVSVRSAASRPRNGGSSTGTRGRSRTIILFLVGEAPGRRATRAGAGEEMPLGRAISPPVYAVTQQLRPAKRRTTTSLVSLEGLEPPLPDRETGELAAVRQGRDSMRSTARLHRQESNLHDPVNSRAHCLYATVERGGRVAGFGLRLRATVAPAGHVRWSARDRPLRETPTRVASTGSPLPGYLGTVR
jgi:hypothetical protein